MPAADSATFEPLSKGYACQDLGEPEVRSERRRRRAEESHADE